MSRKNIILQNIAENYVDNIPQEWFKVNTENFGINWKLFDYQIKALENISKILFLYFTDKNKLYGYYKQAGLIEELENELSITKDDENFNLLKEYITPENNVIPFKSLINRASFWMATGSGKTLVMIKLIELLHNLMKSKLIPKKDILLLAPKDEILKQIEEHIEIYNKNPDLKIEFIDLKRWENEHKYSFIFNEVKVFYYRADNITDKNKDKQIDYKSFYNNGNWYLILDEAHKGEKATSKRQQYFTILSHNGFLFNFSATFTDVIDIVTTVFDFKLDTFLKKGYGKKIYIANSEFKNFKPEKKNKKVINDFKDDEKKEIIAQTLILLSLIRKHWKEIKKVKNDLYHAPLLITLANSVNVENADLKIFYQLLAEIAKNNFDFQSVKNTLYEKLEQNKNYLFGLDEINNKVLQELQNLTNDEFFENVFNTKSPGEIEVLEIKSNSRELAFKLKNAEKPFMLIVASDIVKWKDNVLEGYEFGEALDESFFADINNKEEISILLGSRIFVEGWDSNRPNIISFINIGVDEDAKKFVLQSIGRGIRIEPVKNIRKRFNYIKKKDFTDEEIKEVNKYNQLLETLFVFATNKEVIKNILEELGKQSSQEWVKVKGIKKNENINEEELPLLVPEFDYDGLNNKPFKIAKNDFDKLKDYVKKVDDKVLVLKEDLKVRTLNKFRKDKNFSNNREENFKIEGGEKGYKPEILLRQIDNFFNKPVKRLKKLRILENHIIHYQEIRTDLSSKEVEELEKEIASVLSKKKVDIAKLKEKFQKSEINIDEYTEQIMNINQTNNLKILANLINYEIFKEHYYVPILLKENSKHFQHIIKVPSEIDFLDKLESYIEDSNNKLKDYDWWYFSKIDESLDNIKIPYFDTQKGDYSNFSPDFIFWLKKGNKYYIKFIDPKGTEHTRNPVDKILGFEEFQKDINSNSYNGYKIMVELFYFNNEVPTYIEKNYKKYWTNDLNSIF